jgi:predicted secreted hydrolase
MNRPAKKRLSSSVLFLTILAILVVLSGGAYYFWVVNNATKSSNRHVFSIDDKSVFEPVLPGVPVTLPRDFAFHHDFQQEGWEFFANLLGSDGLHYSVQWNYYRIARDEQQSGGWNSSQIYLSDVVVTSEKGVWKQQRIARGGIGQAGLRDRPFRLWIDNWSWRSISLSPLPGILTVSTDDFSIKLNSSSSRSFSASGKSGYKAHHDLLPLASFGIEAPFIRTTGQLSLNGEIIDVSGQATMSKDWGSELETISGQKNVAINLHLGDGGYLSIAQNRIPHYPSYTYGSITYRDGSRVLLRDGDILMSAIEYSEVEEGPSVPTKWKIKIEKLGIELTTSTRRDDLWHDFYTPYWQGSVFADGTNSGQGMLKVSGY